MKLLILIVVGLLAVAMPLFWLLATVTGIVSYGLHWRRTAHEAPDIVLNPQLGFTMADGGDAIEKSDANGKEAKK